MKFSCTRDNLQKALLLTSHLATKNVNLPILNNVLVRAEEGILRMTTTNLEIAISCILRGKIEEKGECTIPSKLFFDYVNLLTNEKIDLVFSQDTVSIECGEDKTKIKGIIASEFPLVPSVTTKISFELPLETLRRAIGQVLFAATTNEARPELTGVFILFDSKEGKTTLAATDSYRLAEAIIPLSKNEEQESVSVIVPSRTMIEISRILSVLKDDVEAPNTVTVHVSQNQIVFHCGNTELISRTIEGNYPDYQQIIPSVFQTHVVVDKEDMIKAVKTASLFSKQTLYDVTLETVTEKRNIFLKAMDVSRGENITSCQGEITGVNNVMTLNYRYFLDGLGAITEEKISLEMIDAANPCLIKPQGNTNYQYVIMPIRQ